MTNSLNEAIASSTLPSLNQQQPKSNESPLMANNLPKSENFFLSNLSTLSIKLRAIILFTLGSLLAFVLNILQMEYKSNLFPSNVLSFFLSMWWAIPVCGLGAVYIGFCYPYFDQKFGQSNQNEIDWTLIIRCIFIFIGFNHLCAKIQFANASHFFIIFIIFCLVFWYWFDNSKFGLVFNTVNGVSVIIVAHILRNFGVFNYNEIQFNYLQICLLCLTFSGGVTFGNLGRLLDIDFHKSNSNNVHLHLD